MKIYLAALLILGVITVLRVVDYSLRPEPVEGEEVRISGTLMDAPRSFYGNQIITLSDIRIRLPDVLRLKYGDWVEVGGVVTRTSYEANGRPRYVYEIKEAYLYRYEKRAVFQVVVEIQERITSVFYRSIDARQADLMLGIVFGLTDSMDAELYDHLVVTGVLHIVSASGANISIVTSVMLAVLVLFVRRQIALMVTIGGIVGYALLASLDPSIVRASIMAIIMIGASLLGRQHFTLGAIVLSACGMVMVTPELIDDIGFRLSFAATIGIVTIKPLLDSLIARRYRTLISDLTTTIAAQWTTAPILASTFGTFSVLSVIVNACVLWMVAPLMIIGLAAGMSALIMPPITQVLLLLVYPILSLFLFVVEWFSRISYLAEVTFIPGIWIISFYCFTFGGVMVFSKRIK